MQRLFIIRGLPGTGKSTLGRDLAPDYCHAADDYFMVGKEYQFDATKLAAAHADCLARTRAALEAGATVAVANTFTQRWEMQPYLVLSHELKVSYVVIDLFDAGLDNDALAARNAHGVPVEAIKAMRKRYEQAWRRGNPVPPWERQA